MVKEFKDWIDEFVEQGADPEKVTKWPEDFGGGGPEPIKLQEKTVSPEKVNIEVIADKGYHGLGKVTVNAVTSSIDSNIKAENIKKNVAILGVNGTYDAGGGTVTLQEKSVSPTTTVKEVVADSGFDGLSKVTIEAVKLQSKTTSPTLVRQEITPDEGFNGLGVVTIEAVNLQDKSTSPSTSVQEITSDEGYVGLGKVTVGAVALQDKVVKPTTSAQEITPDDGYLGLGKVTVEASEAAETAYYQFIFNNHEDISSKRFRIDWSKLPDFFQETFGINPDLTFSEIAAQVGTSDYAIRFPLAVGDTNTNNKLYFNSEIYFVLEINNNNAYLKRDGYLNGFLNFEVNPPYSSTLREAISSLPTTTTGTSSGIYALLILGVITLTEIN